MLVLQLVHCGLALNFQPNERRCLGEFAATVDTPLSGTWKLHTEQDPNQEQKLIDVTLNSPKDDLVLFQSKNAKGQFNIKTIQKGEHRMCITYLGDVETVIDVTFAAVKYTHKTHHRCSKKSHLSHTHPLHTIFLTPLFFFSCTVSGLGEKCWSRHSRPR